MIVILPIGWLIGLLNRLFSGYSKCPSKKVPSWVKRAVWGEIDQHFKWTGNCPDFVMQLKGKRYRWRAEVSQSFFSKKVNVTYYSKKRNHHKRHKK